MKKYHEESVAFDHGAYVQQLFNKIENETTEAFKKLAMNQKANVAHSHTNDNSNNNNNNNNNNNANTTPSVTNANMLRLHEICLLKKWEKIKPDSIREKLALEQNVRHTDWLMDAELMIPFDDRKVTNARFFLYVLKQEGLFSDIYDIEVFLSEATKQQFMLCSTVSRRIDENLLLTGDYVFLLVDNNINWGSNNNLEEKGKFAEGICKITHEGPKILSEKVIFRNFYFNIVQHHASNPVMAINFV